MAKKILNTQLNYIVHKSNLERAQKDLARLKRKPDVTEEELDRAKANLDVLREKCRIAVEAINISGVSKTSIG
jgi:hypothetical protein